MEALEKRLDELSPALTDPAADWQRMAREAAEDEQIALQNCALLAENIGAREIKPFGCKPDNGVPENPGRRAGDFCGGFRVPQAFSPGLTSYLKIWHWVLAAVSQRLPSFCWLQP